jgi:peptidyl-tRNA hydrolase, PTH1 family
MNWLTRIFGGAEPPARGGAPAFLVAGLGNPGAEYELTPHNLCFLVVDRFAALAGADLRQSYCNSVVGPVVFEGARAILAKPLTYMNRSGEAVRCLLAKHGLTPAELVLVYDDKDLPWGTLRIRAGGSAGGHRGVASVIQSLGTQDFARLRLGIHPGHEVRDTAQYVLAPIRGERLRSLDEWLELAARAIGSLITEGAGTAMTKYNRRA